MILEDALSVEAMNQSDTKPRRRFTLNNNTINEITKLLNSILQKTIAIQNMNVPQHSKDLARVYFIKSVKFSLEELDPKKINQLVVNEARKKHLNKETRKKLT